MTPRLRITFLILILMYLFVGCVSTGDEKTEAQTPLLTDKSTIELEGVVGKWQIVSGNLSSFSNLHFTGEGEFKSDGSYRITTHPLEFDLEEGLLDYSGNYDVEGSEIVGVGKSTIIQNGEVFGASAVDKISAQLDSSGRWLVGNITSVSSFHEGSGEEIATFEFVLEKE